MTLPVDIIIPVHNRADCFLALIQTLRETTSHYRLILVDDASQEETASALRQIASEYPHSILIRSQRQRWWTRAVNLGLRMARTDRVVLLNSDCVLGAGWLEELYAVWDEAASQGLQVAVVGSVLSGEEQRRWSEFRRGKNDSSDYITGHAWCVSMQALSELSVARGTPGIYFNELSQDQIHISSERMACWDLQAMGYATIAAFKSAVGHHGGASWGHNLGAIMGLPLEQVNDVY